MFVVPRRASKTSAKSVIAREREQKAFELKKSGATYAQIGEQLGCSKQSAHAMVGRVLLELRGLVEVDARDVLRLEVERLDAMLLALWPRASAGNEGAIDRVLKIGERRSRLLGLDAPTKVDVTTHEEALKALG